MLYVLSPHQKLRAYTSKPRFMKIIEYYVELLSTSEIDAWDHFCIFRFPVFLHKHRAIAFRHSLRNIAYAKRCAHYEFADKMVDFSQEEVLNCHKRNEWNFVAGAELEAQGSGGMGLTIALKARKLYSYLQLPSF